MAEDAPPPSPLLFLLAEKLVQLENLLESKEGRITHRQNCRAAPPILNHVLLGRYKRVKCISIIFFSPPSSAVTFFQKLNLHFLECGVR